MQITESVLLLAQPIAQELGFHVAGVTYQKQPGSGTTYDLTVYISKAEGGITLDDCAALSKALDEPLDDLNPTQDASYNLIVSSAGEFLRKQEKKNKDKETI